MSRTIISLPDEDKTWLARQASTQRVPMSELVRRAVRDTANVTATANQDA